MWSVSGRVWSTPVQIFGPQAGVGQVIGAWYSTDANFGLQMQYVIEASNMAGTAIENGRIIAFLEIELKS